MTRRGWASTPTRPLQNISLALKQKVKKWSTWTIYVSGSPARFKFQRPSDNVWLLPARCVLRWIQYIVIHKELCALALRKTRCIASQSLEHGARGHSLPRCLSGIGCQSLERGRAQQFARAGPQYAVQQGEALSGIPFGEVLSVAGHSTGPKLAQNAWLPAVLPEL